MKRKQSPITGVDIAGVVLFAGLTAGAYALIARPMQLTKDRQQQAEREAASAVERAKGAKTGLEASEKRLADIERELSLVKVQLEAPSQINRQIDDLTTLAERHGLHIVQMGPGDAARTAWYTSVPIRMSGQGAFPSVVRFLETVEDSFAEVAVEGLSLVSSRNLTDEFSAEASGPSTAENSASPARFQIEFVWYAAPEATTRAPTP